MVSRKPGALIPKSYALVVLAKLEKGDALKKLKQLVSHAPEPRATISQGACHKAQKTFEFPEP